MANSCLSWFGGGIIWENHAVLGGFGNAGELGNLFNENEMKHRPALGELVAHLKSRGVKLEGIQDLLNNFDPSWPGVDEWLNDIAPLLNLTITAIRAVLDPEAIYFGGEAPDKLRDMLIDYCNPPAAKKINMGKNCHFRHCCRASWSAMQPPAVRQFCLLANSFSDRRSNCTVKKGSRMTPVINNRGLQVDNLRLKAKLQRHCADLHERCPQSPHNYHSGDDSCCSLSE